MRSCEGARGKCCSTSRGLCTSSGVATCAPTGAALKTAALHRMLTATRARRIMISSLRIPPHQSRDCGTAGVVTLRDVLQSYGVEKEDVSGDSDHPPLIVDLVPQTS